MTTVAFRNGVIAADTSMTVGDARVGRMRKVVRAPNGDLAGASGSASFAHAFREWVKNGGDGPAPEAKSDQHYFDRGFIARRNGAIEVFEPGGSFLVEAEYYAIGSGAAEARGAMFAGADAVTAVRAAMAHDTYTGGDITVIKADEPS